METNRWTDSSKRLWNEKAAYWHANSIENWERGSRRDIISFFKKYIPFGEVADLGCGDGYGSYLLHREGYRVTGVDLSEEMVRYASGKRTAGLEFIAGDLQNLPFASDTFDAAMAINSLEWVPNPLKALKEIWRITKPGGRVCIAILGPTAKPRENSFGRLTGEEAVCNTMMPWEFVGLAAKNDWKQIAEAYVYKRGVKEAFAAKLSDELKQALTFMTLFILEKEKS